MGLSRARGKAEGAQALPLPPPPPPGWWSHSLAFFLPLITPLNVSTPYKPPLLPECGSGLPPSGPTPSNLGVS